MSEKDPIEEIIDDLVVFRNPNGEYFSNSMYWGDQRIRDAWTAKHSDEAKAQTAEDDSEAETEDEVEDEVAYADMTNEELRTELAGRGLSVDGKKVELISRLEADDATQE